MLALLVVAGIQAQDLVGRLDALAQARDVEGIASLAKPELKPKLGFLRTNGAYDTGRFGWHAVELRGIGGKDRFVVFTTRLTSEDIGDQVFRFDGSRLTGYVPEDDGQGTWVRHHALDVRFDLGSKTAIIADTCTFESRTGSAFLARMSDQYRVESVVDEEGKPVEFNQAGGVVCLPGKTGKFSYAFKYRGVVNLPRYAGSITSDEVLLTNDYWYPMVARTPATYDLTVHVPVAWTVMAQGEEGVSTVSGSERVSSFRMTLPMVYFSFSAGKFNRVETTIGGRRFVSASPKLTQAELVLQNRLNAPVIDFFDKTLAPYPFTWWGSMDTPAYGGGALEAYSYATYGTGWLPAEDAHEPSHTWWGGILPNTYLHSLWNESFAVYSEGLYAREVNIGNRQERRQAFVSEMRTSGAYKVAPCADAPPSIGGAASELGYGKGGKVLQMLEAELGTPTMIKALQTWLSSHSKGDSAEWEEFEAVVNKVAGKSYKWFFDQWVRRTGWAEFTIERCDWRDGQVNAMGRFTGDPYFLTCEVMLEDANGKRSFSTAKIGPTPDAGDKFFVSIPCATKPKLVSFDPWLKLLRNAEGNERSPSLESELGGMAKYVDPAHSDYCANVRSRKTIPQLPADLNGVFLAGHPSTLPRLKALCAKAGFSVNGNQLAYGGTTIDLTKGAALALIDLGQGKQCAIGLGKTLVSPTTGRARLALVDELGHFLRGVTQPKTSGFLTFRL